jgi:adenylate cyclase
MDTVLGFEHGMILLTEADAETLALAASRGYEESGVGATVKIGTGVIDVVAKRRRMMRMGNIRSQKGYLASVRSQSAGADTSFEEQSVMPGLPEVQS